MLQPHISTLLKRFSLLNIILHSLITLILSQDTPRTLYNLPPLPGEENDYTLNLPTTTSTKKPPLQNSIPPQQLPLLHQPLGPLLKFPLPQVPFFDRYNEANMKSELPPLPEESLKGYYDSDGMFVPNQPKEVEENKTHHILPKNQMAAAATFVSVKGNQPQHDSSGEDIPENIFPEPVKKKDNNNQKDSGEKEFILSKSNVFIDGFGSQNEDDSDEKNDEHATEEKLISHIAPKVIEDHGDLSFSNRGNKNEEEINFQDPNKPKFPPSTTHVTIAPIGLKKQFQNSFITTNKKPFDQQNVSPMTQQFIRTTLSPKLVIRNRIQNTQPQYKNLNTGSRAIPNFRKHSFQTLQPPTNTNNNIRNDAFLKKLPTTQSQFDLPIPAGNDKNNNLQTNNGGISDKETSLHQQPTNNKISANSFSNHSPTIGNSNRRTNEQTVRIIHNGRQNIPPIPPVENPSIPNEKNPADGSKKKSKVPGKLDLPDLVSLPSPITDRLGNGEQQQRNTNFIRNGIVTQLHRNHIPKTVIRTTQVDIRNPTDSMFTNELDWFDWEMYQNGRRLGFLPPNLINSAMLPKQDVSTLPDNKRQLQSPPMTVNPNNFISRSTWEKFGTQQQQQQQPRASGAQQLPVQVSAADEDIPPDNVVLTNPPQLNLNIPGYEKQTPLPETSSFNQDQNTIERLVPFENTNTGRVPTSQLTTGLPYQSSYNNGNYYNTNNNNYNYNNRWNNNNYNNNNYNRNFYQQQPQNTQPSLLNLFSINPFAGFNLFG